MNKTQTKNSIIDASLTRGENTEQILAKVVKAFPQAVLSAVKRQIYSRRNVLKTRTLVTA
jgi:hypothetical protein